MSKPEPSLSLSLSLTHTHTHLRMSKPNPSTHDLNHRQRLFVALPLRNIRLRSLGEQKLAEEEEALLEARRNLPRPILWVCEI